MSKLVLTRGYPASGKTTYAKRLVTQEGYIRVSRDDIRRSLFGAQYKTVLPRELEAQVTQLQTEVVVSALRAGLNVVIDDTNLRRKYAVRWVNIAQREGAEWHVADFPVDVEVCLERNRLRPPEEQVGDDVICILAKKFPIQNWPFIEPSGPVQDDPAITPYTPDPKLPPAYIFDMDGTLSGMGDRDPYDGSRAIEDPPHKAVVDLARTLVRSNNIIILTGRKARHKDVTQQWLQKHHVKYDLLLTRADDDGREDWIVKQELFDRYIAPQFYVKGVFDDRLQVVRMWHQKGLPVFRVGDPEAVF